MKPASTPSLAHWRSQLASAREAVRLARPDALARTQALLRRPPDELEHEDLLWLHETLSRAAWGNQDYLLMRRHASRLGKLATQHCAPSHRLAALQLLAQAAHELGQSQQELRHWLHCLDEAEGLNDLVAVCEACVGIGNVLSRDGPSEQVRQLFDFAQQCAADIGHNRLRFRSGLLLAACYANRNDAGALAGQLELLGGLPHYDVDAAWLIDLANFRCKLALLQGRLLAAREQAVRAQASARQGNYRWGEIQARLLQADIASQCGDLDQAIGHALSTLDFAGRHGRLQLLPESVLRQLADWQEGCQRHADALLTLEHWHEQRQAALAQQGRRSRPLPPHQERILALHLQLVTLKLANRRLQGALDRQQAGATP
ncbi:hypothetical protein [Chitinilyticum litopenaei]|uniref:hypothetical protein n=1 Tax=Chitinilyticum litopenaei TaxID=1121276 RepID=UPI0003FD7CF6|nr:hypothetical protein [Chitinilyticum litopenaei]